MLAETVQTLITQHETLVQEISQVSNLSSDINLNANEIAEKLKKFTQDLNIHLRLENEIFYPELLQSMHEKTQDTSNTEKFIAQMKEIEGVVVSFLTKYSSASAIESNSDSFKQELNTIIETLQLRIESEESGIFTY